MITENLLKRLNKKLKKHYVSYENPENTKGLIV